ncbi:hypothetical protein [Nocardia cyriacigeorgica]|uniref:hypothetical protein n=1 Tax=Nocardia cyriacigeorgica TaxID=135487 RepID=UPI001895C6DB|nr:hypothetical protein [Nocardia cyriacigeorgica]MBF6416923.1 hypothetical protein [Nocardia cyriacigeorgica]
MKYIALPLTGLIVSAALVLATPWPTAAASIAAVVVFGVLFAFILGYTAGRIESTRDRTVHAPITIAAEDAERYADLRDLLVMEGSQP